MNYRERMKAEQNFRGHGEQKKMYNEWKCKLFHFILTKYFLPVVCSLGFLCAYVLEPDIFMSAF